MSTNWFLDFDDTLASGPSTWGLEYAFPRLIQNHQLPYDEQAFREAIMIAQKQGNGDSNPQQIMNEMFEKLNWPQSLVQPFLQDLVMNYKPELFEDTLPFLKQVQAKGDSVVVISNNRYAPDLAREMGIDSFIHQFFTPKLYPGSRPKPDRSLWDCVLQVLPEMDHHRSVILGDDPWSEGDFADQCGIRCVIIDRMRIFTSLYSKKPYQWIQSLLDPSIHTG